MKKHMMFYLLSRFTKLDRKVKTRIFVVAGLFGFIALFLVGLAGYVAFQAGGYAINQIQAQTENIQIDKNLPTQALAQAQEQVQNIGQTVTSANCVETLTGLLNPDSWLRVPLAETFKTVQTSCLGAAPEQKS